MKRYIVKSVCEPTELQIKETGRDSREIAFYGKACEMLALTGKRAKEAYAYTTTYKWWIREFAYKRECDARKAWVLHNTVDTEYWKHTNTIIEVNV